MAAFARDQADCHLSPALVPNLERTGRPTSATSEQAIWDPVETLPRERAARAPARAPATTVARVLAGQPLGAARLAEAGVGGRGGHPLARRPGAPAVQLEGRPARQLPVRPARGAARTGGAGARLERVARQADRGRLHARGPRRLDRADGPLHDDGGRARRAWSCTTPTATGCSRAGTGSTTARERIGATVVPVSGGFTRPAGDAALRPRRAGADLRRRPTRW